MKHLRAVRRGERIHRHYPCGNKAGRIELIFGSVTVALLPRKAKFIVEELFQNIRSRITVKVRCEYKSTAIMNVRNHLMEHCSVFRHCEALIRTRIHRGLFATRYRIAPSAVLAHFNSASCSRLAKRGKNITGSQKQL